MNNTIKLLFEKSNLTQEEFAKVVGISRSRLCNIIYNKQTLKLSTLETYLEKIKNSKRKIVKISDSTLGENENDTQPLNERESVSDLTYEYLNSILDDIL